MPHDTVHQTPSHQAHAALDPPVSCPIHVVNKNEMDRPDTRENWSLPPTITTAASAPAAATPAAAPAMRPPPKSTRHRKAPTPGPLTRRQAAKITIATAVRRRPPPNSGRAQDPPGHRPDARPAGRAVNARPEQTSRHCHASTQAGCATTRANTDRPPPHPAQNHHSNQPTPHAALIPMPAPATRSRPPPRPACPPPPSESNAAAATLSPIAPPALVPIQPWSPPPMSGANTPTIREPAHKRPLPQDWLAGNSSPHTSMSAPTRPPSPPADKRTHQAGPSRP